MTTTKDVLDDIKQELKRRMEDNFKAEEKTHANIFGSKAVEDNDILAYIESKEKRLSIDPRINEIWETLNPKDEGMGLETANIDKEAFSSIAEFFYMLDR